MDRIWQILEDTPSAGGPFTPEAVLLSLLLAFVLGQALAWVYYFTHSGLSYSKSFVQSPLSLDVSAAVSPSSRRKRAALAPPKLNMPIS